MAGAGSPRTTRGSAPSAAGVGGAGPRRIPVPGSWPPAADVRRRCPGSTTSGALVLFSRPLRHAAQGVAALAVAAGSVGVAHYDKAVEVSVDGQPTSVHVLGSTVADVLDKQDIAVGPHDVVVPSLASSVSDGDHISVRYGRKLTVTVDGQTKEYWTTATDGRLRAAGPRHPRRRRHALRLALPAARPRRSHPRGDDPEEGHLRRRRQDPHGHLDQLHRLRPAGRARCHQEARRRRVPGDADRARRRHEGRPQARRHQEGARDRGRRLRHDQAEGLLALQGPDQGRHAPARRAAGSSSARRPGSTASSTSDQGRLAEGHQRSRSPRS